MNEQFISKKLGALSELGNNLSRMGARKILLVTGKKSFELSGAQTEIAKLGENFEITRFSDFEINPKFEDAIKAVNFAKTWAIDTVMAIGGGSVIDMAKLVLAFYRAEDNLPEIVTGARKAKAPGINLIAAPTTAGSGSESTHFAVVYYQKVKYSVVAPFLKPTQVILDGLLTQSNSPFQRAVNGLDALAQGIESYWASGATEQSRAYARKAIPVLFNNLQESVAGSITDSGLQEMTEAANFAGQAINISKTTAAHAYSYAFTSTYGIPHGQAVWLTLPALFRIHYHADASSTYNIEDTEKFHDVMEDLVAIMNLDKTHLEKTLTDFTASLGLETSMQKIGASSREKRQHISRQVNMERMSNNPVLLTPHLVDGIFAC